MGERSLYFSILSTQEEVRNAVTDLRDAGIGPGRISVVGKDYFAEEYLLGRRDPGKERGSRKLLEGFREWLRAVLEVSGFFWFPKIGIVFAAGPLVSAVAAGPGGTVSIPGLGALGEELCLLGLPGHSALRCESEIADGRFLLLAHGATEEVRRTAGIPVRIRVPQPVLQVG